MLVYLEFWLQRTSCVSECMFRHSLGMLPGPCGLEDRETPPPTLNSWRTAADGGAFSHECSGNGVWGTPPG